jgi:CHAD domain-containing protein
MARAQNLQWDKRAGVAANAGRELPRMVSAYFSQVRAFLAKDGTLRELHRLRLASKRLRYTLELFRACYPAGLEDRLDALKVLQDWLGEVNDAVASAEMLRGALERRPKVRRFLEERAAEHAAGFARHWKETFDAPGQEAWWTGFLARPLKQTLRGKRALRGAIARRATTAWP